jgi:hypothetical protein
VVAKANHAFALSSQTILLLVTLTSRYASRNIAPKALMNLPGVLHQTISDRGLRKFHHSSRAFKDTSYFIRPGGQVDLVLHYHPSYVIFGPGKHSRGGTQM